MLRGRGSSAGTKQINYSKNKGKQRVKERWMGNIDFRRET